MAAQLTEKLNSLFQNIQELLGENFTREHFDAWVNCYDQGSREFHDISHLLDMTANEKISQADGLLSASAYTLVGDFFHDVNYPSIGEAILDVSKPFISPYLEDCDVKNPLKPIAEGDRIGQMVYDVFGFEPGHTLSPFPFPGNAGGMNEFVSALSAAGQLKSLGMDDKFILGVVAVIEGTIAFRGADRMDKLRERVENAAKKMHLEVSPQELDEMIIATTHSAYKDVRGFMGGLDPLSDKTPTTLSVLKTTHGGDMLSPEEVRELRVDKNSPASAEPGDYPPRKYLDAMIKRAGLYHLVIPGDAEKGSIPNLYYQTTLSSGEIYPPAELTQKASELAYKNIKPVRLATYARLVSAGLVNAFAELSGASEKNIPLNKMVSGIGDIVGTISLPTDASEDRKLAFDCLAKRLQGSGYDTTKSSIASVILSQLDDKKMEELGKASRDLLLPTPLNEPQIAKLNKDHPGVYKDGESKEAMFLKLATEYLGQTVEKTRDNIARVMDKADGFKAAATNLRALPLPKVKSM